VRINFIRKFNYVVENITFSFNLFLIYWKKINLFQVGHDYFLWYLEIINKLKEEQLTSSINKLEHLKLNILLQIFWLN
jgi:hypothetical protein